MADQLKVFGQVTIKQSFTSPKKLRLIICITVSIACEDTNIIMLDKGKKCTEVMVAQRVYRSLGNESKAKLVGKYTPDVCFSY